MKKNLLTCFFSIFIATSAFAQLQVTPNNNANQLAQTLAGQGVTISGATLNCPSNASPANNPSGTFVGTSSNIGLTGGVLLTTGDVQWAVGPNNSPNAGADNQFTLNDPDIQTIDVALTNDVCMLEFNAVPPCSTLSFTFAFGSDEYSEFVNSINDGFGIFVTGINPSGPNYVGYNMALIPSTATPVSINNVNNGNYTCPGPPSGPCTNCTSFIDNCSGATVQYDGFTTPITVTLAVSPCASYHFKLAIADANDQIYDSGVFFAKQSLVCNISFFAVTTSSTLATCSSNTGTATATPANGTPPYTYSWSPGGQTTQTATGLVAGTYTVTVADLGGCSTVDTVIVTSTPLVTFSFTSITNVACFGNSTGSASVNVLTGTPPYTYLWNPSLQTSSTATALSAGTYKVTVTDSFGCKHLDSIIITSPPALSHTFSQVNASCFGFNNGSATVNISGGTLPYTYSWNSIPVQTTQTDTGLAKGTYIVVVTDAHGCSFTDSVHITQPLPLTHAFSNILNIDCFGNPTGGATINVSGGTVPYSYSWNTIPIQTDSIADTLYAGVFTVRVTDTNGCTFADSVTITTPTGLGVSSPVITNVDCFGNSTGSATVTPFGGTPGYTYLWTPSLHTSATATGLPAGIDSVRITDSNGCIIRTLVQITEPALLTSDSSQTNILCFGDSTGTAAVTAAGGTTPYSYLWSNGQITSSISNLPIGNYSVMITDAHGCKDSSAVTITQLPQLTATFNEVNILCFGDSTGTDTIIVSGGKPSYTYLWNPTATVTATAIGLWVGTYSVLVTDSFGCTRTFWDTLTQPAAPISIVSSKVNVLCNPDSTGTAAVVAAGGTAPYSYLWNNNSTTPSISHLPAGNYKVIITDTNGCKDSSAVIITQPPPITTSITPPDTTICYGTSATVTATAGGGTPGYTYLWMPGGMTTATITVSPLVNTTYTAQVTDSNGCVASHPDTAIITVAPLPVVTISTSPASLVFFPETICFTGDNTNISSWQWNFADNSTASGNSACHDFSMMGTYCVTLIETNNMGCIHSAEQCVSEVGVIIPNVFSPNDDGLNDLFFINLVADGITYFRCEIYDRWGLKISELNRPRQGWEGFTTSGSPVSVGTYYFVLSVSWGNDLSIRKAGFISLVR